MAQSSGDRDVDFTIEKPDGEKQRPRVCCGTCMEQNGSSEEFLADIANFAREPAVCLIFVVGLPLQVATFF